MRRVRRKMTLWGRARATMRKRLLSGLLVVVPLGITAFVLNFIYTFTAGPLANVVRRMLSAVSHDAVKPLPQVYIMAISVVLFVALVYIIGLVTTAYVGRKLLNLAEAIIQRIPVVKTVYGATKQVMESLSLQDGASSYKSAVLVEFPQAGAYSVAFVTGTARTSDGQEFLKVFVPTTPNPTTGFFQYIKADKVLQSDLSVEDAVKVLMSCGIVSPDLLKINSIPRDFAAEAAADVEPDDVLGEDEEYVDVDDEPEAKAG